MRRRSIGAARQDPSRKVRVAAGCPYMRRRLVLPAVLVVAVAAGMLGAGVPAAAGNAGPAACPVGASAADPGCGPVGPLSAGGGPLLHDALGRAVVLHGVDAVYKRPPYELTVSAGHPWSFTAADAAAIAGLGFDVVRLGVLWQGIEPGTLGPNSPQVCTRGPSGHPHQWDPAVANAYLARVRQVVDLLGRYGVFTLVDMHQDVYNQAFAGEGAPAWAVCTDGLPATNTGDWSANYAEPAVGVAYAHFWSNDVVGNLQGNYDRAWRAVARTFAGNPHVAAFDLFNEPFGTPAFTVLGAAVVDARIECAYTGTAHPGRGVLGAPLACPPGDPAQGIIPTIQAVDPTTPIFYEPDVTSDFGNVDWIGPMPYPHLVLDFHDYCLAGSVAAPVENAPVVCAAQERQTLRSQAASRAAAADGANPGGPAWFMSEFGAEAAGRDLSHMVARADRHLLGWAYWQWKHYQDPTGNAAEALATTGPGGTPRVDPARAAILSEPYAEAVAGTPLSMGYDPATDTFALVYRPDPAVRAPTVVFVPVARHYPGGYCASVVGGRVTSSPGASHLTVAASPTAPEVAVHVSAGRCR